MAKVTIVIEDLPDQMVGVSCTSEPGVAVPKNVSLYNTLAQNLAKPREKRDRILYYSPINQALGEKVLSIR